MNQEGRVLTEHEITRIWMLAVHRAEGRGHVGIVAMQEAAASYFLTMEGLRTGFDAPIAGTGEVVRFCPDGSFVLVPSEG